MRVKEKWFLSLLLPLVLAWSLTACGGSGDEAGLTALEARLAELMTTPARTRRTRG